MGNAVIGWSDWGDVASIEAVGNEPASGAVAANLQEPQPRKVWQSTSLSDLYVEIDRGSAQALNLVALLYTNATAAATWRVRAADDQASLSDGTADYDSTEISLRAAGADDTWSRPHGLLWIPAGITRRWLRIDVFDAANPDGVFRAGRLVVANAWQPKRNVQHPLPFAPRDDSEQNRTDGGALFPTEVGDTYLAAELRYKFLSESDALEHLYEFRRRRGRRSDLLAVLDPDDDTYLQQRILYGLIERDDPIIHEGFRRFEHRISMQEMS